MLKDKADLLPSYIRELVTDMANKEPVNDWLAEGREIFAALVRCKIYRDIEELVSDIILADPSKLVPEEQDLFTYSVLVGHGSDGLRRLRVILDAALASKSGMEMVMSVGSEDSAPNAENISVAHQKASIKARCIQGLMMLCIGQEFPGFGNTLDPDCYYVAADGKVLLMNS